MRRLLEHGHRRRALPRPGGERRGLGAERLVRGQRRLLSELRDPLDDRRFGPARLAQAVGEELAQPAVGTGGYAVLGPAGGLLQPPASRSSLAISR
jgi:hypothetical protein